MAIPERMDGVCVLVDGSWAGAGTGEDPAPPEGSQGRPGPPGIGNFPSAPSAPGFRIPFHFSLLWHFRVSLVLGSAPPDLGKLRYPCTIPLFPDCGTKSWTDTPKSTFLRADPMEKEKFLLPSPFPGCFLQHPSITLTSSVRNGIGLPSRAAQGIRGDGKHQEKGNSCQLGHKDSRGCSEAPGPSWSDAVCGGFMG